MNKTITVDFYSVKPPAVAKSLPEVFGALLKKEQPSVKYTGSFFLIKSVTHSGHQWHGDITRVRAELPVTRGSATGKTEVIPCSDDEGPFEQAAFIYDPATTTLVIQRNRAGGATTGFIQCVQQYGEFLDSVELEALIEKKVWERVAKLKHVTKFEIKVAGLQSPRVLQQQGYGVNAIGDFMETMSAPSVQLTASIGRGRGHRALNAQAVKEAAKRLFKISSKEVPEIAKIEIGGRDEDDDSDVIDLIKGRISEKISVPRASDKTLPLGERLNALHLAWKNRRDEVHLLYKEDEA